MLPADGPATRALLRADIGMGEGVAEGENPTLDRIVSAVNAVVRELPKAQVADGHPDWDDPTAAHVKQGAAMLAVRLYRRKDSPDGVAAFGAEGPVYVQRNDPDVAMLLGLGAYLKPQVG